MNAEEVMDGIEASVNAIDHYRMIARREEQKLVLLDADGTRWWVLLAEVRPELGHSAEDCPQRIERPETVIPASVFHGCQGEE